MLVWCAYNNNSFLNHDLDFAGEPNKIYSLVKDLGISINGKWGFPDGLLPTGKRAKRYVCLKKWGGEYHKRKIHRHDRFFGVF